MKEAIGNNENKRVLALSINWRLFWTLLVLVAVGLIALIPYGLTLEGEALSLAALPVLVPQFIVQIILYSVLLWVGIKLSNKVGLEIPFLGQDAQTGVWKTILLAVGLGVSAGAAMILLDAVVFAPRLTAELALMEGLVNDVRPPVWQGFLASFYGGIVEEVMMRLFLMTLIIWLGSGLGKKQPSRLVVWFAILFAGLAFGLAHLPTAVVMGVPLTPLYIVRTLVLNSAGILYGWLYWKRGFESAMVAHFSTDLVVHVLGAALAAWLA
ncbi:MAG: CPBP family intramembrane glutamic endopeptidase [Anaerolineae bacterium]|jgi:membrane protease YdiL (CAAX protease family)|nr:CPBP family intramembrane glutamic endopeptidase [Anaerolineae bacterium]